MKLINIYRKKALKLFTDELIGRTLLNYFNEYADNKDIDKLTERCTEYSIKRELTPNEKYGVAMIIHYATEINENNEK